MKREVVIIRTPKGSLLTKDPNPSEYYYTDYYEDLGVSYLASCLKVSRVDVNVVDTEFERISEIEIAHRALEYDCRIYAISVHAYDFVKVALRIIVEIKRENKDSIVILGGHPIADMADQIMGLFGMVDFICRGEGEENFVELVNALLDERDYSKILGINYRKGGKIYRNQDSPRLRELDKIPYPYRYIFEDNKILSPYYAMVYGSRGCYGNCTMCSVCAFYKKENRWIPRSAENVVDEIEEIYVNYGVKIFSLIDSDFIGPGREGYNRAKNIAELIIERNLDIKFDIACRVNSIDKELFSILKHAGLYNVFLGVESGQNKVLQQLRKGVTVQDNLKAVNILNELDIDMEVGFIMIFPDTTLSDIEENLQFIKKLNVFQPYRLGSRLYTNPGFEITGELEKKEIVKGNILEKHYKISDMQVLQYYNLWNELYQIVLPLINKMLVFQLHVLWKKEYMKLVKNMEKDILKKMIELLEVGIEYIKKSTLEQYQVDRLKENIKRYIEEKDGYLHRTIESMENGLPQYEWLGREVKIY